MALLIQVKTTHRIVLLHSHAAPGGIIESYIPDKVASRYSGASMTNQ